MWTLIIIFVCLFLLDLSRDILNRAIRDFFLSKEKRLIKKKQKKCTKEELKKTLERIEVEAQMEAQKEREYFKSLPNKYGEFPNIIMYGNQFKSRILVFKTSRIIVIEKKEYKFEDIISFSVISHNQDKQELETKTSLGSVVGRSLIGGLVAGPAGAIIGGATAKKKTKTSTPVYNYTPDIKIVVNDFDNPEILLHQPNDHEKIINILTIITNSNKNDERLTQG